MKMSGLVNVLTSAHFAPSVVGALAAGGLFASGQPPKTCAVVAGAGVLVSGLVFLMEPIRTLRSKSKEHHVGIREIAGDPTSGLPPVTVFYPTKVAPKAPIPYLPFNDSRFSEGVAHYAHVPSWLLRDLRWNRVDATLNAEPLPLQSDGSDASRPVVLFSHGLGAYSRLQTRLLMELAARGAIVFAMTHTDRSAAFSRDVDNANVVFYDNAAQNIPDDREPMLAKRVRETLVTLLRIQSGKVFRDMGYEDFSVRTFLSEGVRVTLSGHSFGGATALAAAQESYAIAKERTVVANVVVFDPWHIPLQRSLFWEPLESGRKPYLFRTLQYFSAEWKADAESRAFFQKLNAGLEKQEALTPEVRQRLSAAAGTRNNSACWNTIRQLPHVDHTHITDASLLIPVHKKWYATRGSTSLILECAEGLLAFINQEPGRHVSFMTS